MKHARSTGSRSVQNWGTPPEVFALASKLWGPYTLDAAAEPDNALCSTYFSVETDGLHQSWAGCNVFVNPPFWDVARWVSKASQSDAATILVPAALETEWFQIVHDLALCAVVMRPRVTYVFPAVPRDKTNAVIPPELLPESVNGPPLASMLVRFKAGIQPRRDKYEALPVHFVDLRERT